MLQPKSLLMKRGTLLGKKPRVDRKVFTTIGFPDFASGISVVFSGCCPATVSDSETVFLCPLSSSVAAPQPIHNSNSRPILSLDANTLFPNRGCCHQRFSPHRQSQPEHRPQAHGGHQSMGAVKQIG